MADLGIEGIGPAEPVGSGGFGTVYRAEQLGLSRFVAVKVLPHLGDSAATARYERERRALGSLSGHPGIVSVFDWGFTVDGRPYLVMEFLPGGSLNRVLAETGAMPAPLVASVGVALADALAAAHAQGVLHRDVKPENVMVSAYGLPVLCDFGIATLADASRTVGSSLTASIAHAPPEVMSGAKATEASDVWSLASTLYTLLTGLPPFVARVDDTMQAILGRLLTQDVPDLRDKGVPEKLAAVIGAALQKDPEGRTATARQLHDQLAGVMSESSWPSAHLPVVEVQAPVPQPGPAATAPPPSDTSGGPTFVRSTPAGGNVLSSSGGFGSAPTPSPTGPQEPVVATPLVTGPGPPPPPGRKTPVLVAVMAIAVAVAAVGLVVGVIAGRGGADKTAAPPATTTPSTAASTTSSGATPTTASTASTVTPTVVPLRPAGVTASAERRGFNLRCTNQWVSYSPANLIDGHLETGWGAGENNGNGQSATVTFAQRTHFRRVGIAPGYLKVGPRQDNGCAAVDAFRYNRIIRAVRFTFDSGLVTQVALTEVEAIQYFDVDTVASTVTITILDNVQPPGADDDTIISEAAFEGYPG